MNPGQHFADFDLHHGLVNLSPSGFMLNGRPMKTRENIDQLRSNQLKWAENFNRYESTYLVFFSCAMLGVITLTIIRHQCDSTQFN